MNVVLDTRQKVTRWNDLNKRDHPMKLGDTVVMRGNRCPTCFAMSHEHDAAECYELFPPVVSVRARISVDCPCCGNTMMEDELNQAGPVILCVNRHCPEVGKGYRPPEVRLRPLYE